jgi:hypothetical protein
MTAKILPFNQETRPESETEAIKRQAEKDQEQQDAAEFSEAQIGVDRRFSTQAEAQARTDQVEGMLKPDQHMEAGMPLLNSIPEHQQREQLSKLVSLAERTKKIEDLKASDTSPFGKMEGLIEELNKAA